MNTDKCAATLSPYMGELDSIWADMGLRAEQRERRVAVVERHMITLLEDMVEEEREVRDRLQTDAHDLRANIADLSKDLQMEYTQPVSDLGMLSLVDHLKNEFKRLNEVKSARLSSLKKLKDVELALCEVLAMEPYYIPSGTIPSQEQLDCLQKHIHQLTDVKVKRSSEFLSTRRRLHAIIENLGEEATESFTLQVTEEDPSDFLLSQSNMAALERLLGQYEQREKKAEAEGRRLREQLNTLWNRLEIEQSEREAFTAVHIGYKKATLKQVEEEIGRCEKLKLANIQSFVGRARQDLVQLWNDCYYSEDQRRPFQAHMESEDFTENLLAAHEAELKRVKAYYDKYAPMFKKIEKRKELWEAMLMFDRKEQDPNRYNNRGGGLLKEEKERNHVLKQLPKVEGQLKGAVEEWEMEHCEVFLMEGMCFTEYCESEWKKYHENKESEKAQRLKTKKEEMKEEIMFGSKAVTPAKRRFCGLTTTPGRTPKQRKMNDTTATPMSACSSKRTPFSAVSVNRTPQKDQAQFASPNLPPPRKAPSRKAATKTPGKTTKTPGETSGRTPGKTAGRTPGKTSGRTPGKTNQLNAPSARYGRPGTPSSRTRAGLLSVAKSTSDLNALNESIMSAADYRDFKNGITAGDRSSSVSSLDNKTSSRIWK